MVKLLLLLVLASWACRQWTGQWPWVHWQRMTGPTAVERARRLLGVEAGAGRGAIIEAHKKLIARVHPDRGGDAALVHEANDARDLLLARLGTETGT
ncbi:molecular chaperone DnaJ [Novosphingobium sp. SG707]|uniref:molecular chaperone DnaJ n=1 Tax=Novosphingobium sp. SG707 TaxID=2586996 RepID=UPI00144878AC|nr:molecular chaperone DnaJ [Novosphingobium sp. SG707]NKI99840.1 hypothetical protein [Novosphingobium sp. SG707]